MNKKSTIENKFIINCLSYGGLIPFILTLAGANLKTDISEFYTLLFPVMNQLNAS